MRLTDYRRPAALLSDERSFQAWLDGLHLPAEGRALIKRIRSSEPLRTAEPTPFSKAVRYPSRLIGAVVQAEAGSTEFEWLTSKEFDPEFLEIYDQADGFTISHTAAGGRRQTSHIHTPDYFALLLDRAGFFELKPEEELERLAKKWPDRYVKIGKRWDSPPSRVVVEPLGLFYEVVSDAEIPKRVVAALRFLEDFMDDEPVSRAVQEAVTHATQEDPGLRLLDVLALPLVAPDDVYRLLLRGEVAGDLERERVDDTVNFHLFPTVEMAVASRPQPLVPDDGDESDGTARAVPPDLANASAKRLQGAMRRHAVIQQVAAGEQVRNPDRTVRAWKARHRDAEAASRGSGIAALMDKIRPGNTTPRYTAEVRELAAAAAKKHYVHGEQSSFEKTYAAFDSACSGIGLVKAPSRQWVRDRIREVMTDPKAVRSRYGSRVAYQEAPFYWFINADTPPHGMYPCNIVHLDHSRVDIQLLSRYTRRRLGRPWLTVAIDAFTRRILAFWLSFDPPSRAADMMAVRLCAMRWRRLPRMVVTDYGADFRSVYFQALLASADVVQMHRPKGASRAGTLIERMFQTTWTELIHDLLGNTKAARNVRQLSREVDPEQLATLDLEILHAMLWEFFFEIYDTTTHSALGMSPREAWEIGQAYTGYRNRRELVVDRTFMILTLPSTPKGHATIDDQRGVKINTRWYWNDSFALRDEELVPVAFDPLDITGAYAQLDERWLDLDGTPNLQRFRPLSQRALAIVSEELRAERSIGSASAVSDRLIARHLTSELSTRLEAQLAADADVQAVMARLARTYPLLAPPQPTAPSVILPPDGALDMLDDQLTQPSALIVPRRFEPY